MNRVELVGGLTRDPEVSFLPSGAVLWFATIAVNGARYDSQAGTQIVTTTYVALSAIGWIAEELTDAAYSKGDELYVLGELDQYEVEKDGKKDRKTRVRPVVVHATRRGRKHVAAKQDTDPWEPAPAPGMWSTPVVPLRDEPPF